MSPCHLVTTALLFCCGYAALDGAGAAAGAEDPLARVGLPGENTNTGRRLAAADRLVKDGQFAEAVAEYRQIIEDAGDDLVRWDPLDARHTIQARWLCHRRLAALPAAALRIYREKVDVSARKWLEQGESERDVRLLRKVVEEAFCSRSGDRALNLLGDLAFERGDFHEAERCWRMIVSPAGENEEKPDRKDAKAAASLVFPEPSVDTVRVRAKQLLARLFQGEQEEGEEGWKNTLAAFRATHKSSAGRLAGRSGNYADILQALADAEASAPVSSLDESAWPTFAGAFARNRIVQGPFKELSRRYALREPTWTQRLDRDAERAPVKKDRPVEPLSRQARSLAFYPVVAGDQVLVADARAVTAYDLRTGKATVWYDLVNDGKNGALDLSLELPAPPDLRYTLTVTDDCVYARMGAQGLGAPKTEEQKKGAGDSFLVCLNRRSKGNRERWVVKANKTDKATDIFEGAPVVHDGRVYSAVTRFDGSAVTAIACYDADSGAPRWRQTVDVCAVREQREGAPRFRHHLLTLAGSKVVYCSHAGAIVALEADTGRRAWAMRYPGRGGLTDEALPSPRDLAPCIHAAGRLFAAPADYDRILCLDPETGRTLWESIPPCEVVHLLGVARQRLIFTTPRDIRALDVTTGQTLRDWMNPDDGVVLPPFGRGLLLGAWVLWSTVDGLRVLDQETGQPLPGMPCNQHSNKIRGNLILGNGCLVVADTNSISAYVPPGRLLEERQREANANPKAPSARYLLALAEADAGLSDQAVKNLALVEREDGRAGRVNAPVVELARARRHEVLLEEAERAGARKQWNEAGTLLARAAAKDFPPSERLEAQARLAALWTSAGQPARAVAAWQGILADAALSRLVLSERRLADDAWRKPVRAAGKSEPPLPQRAGVYAAQRIEALMRAHGPAVYEPFERQAEALAASAQGERRREILERLGREFPNAAVTGRNLVAQEARKPEVRAPRLAVPPEIPLPLERTWRISLGDPASEQPDRLLVPEESEGPSPCDGVFFTRGQEPDIILACHSAATGKPRWQRAFPHTLFWIGLHAGKVLAAGPRSIHCLALTTGALLWEMDWAEDSCHCLLAPRGLVEHSEPVERGSSGTQLPCYPLLDRVGYPFRGLGHFRLAGSRLFFLDGERRLCAVDIDRGRILWSQWAPGAAVRPLPPGGRFFPSYHAGERWLVVQTASGRCRVIDSRTGRTLHEIPTSTEPWPQPPLALDENRILLVIDARNVVLLDPAAGKVLWQRKTVSPSLTALAPKALGNGSTLLLLVDDWQLERLDPRTGEPVWIGADPRWLDKSTTSIWNATIDQDAVYFTGGNALHARALADGRRLWDVPLPPSSQPCRLVRTRDSLLVFPAQAERNEAQRRRPWLLGGYLLAFPRLPVWDDFHVTFRDPKTGRCVQQLSFRVEGPGTALQVVKNGLVVAVHDSARGLTAANER